MVESHTMVKHCGDFFIQKKVANEYTSTVERMNYFTLLTDAFIISGKETEEKKDEARL